MCEEGACVLEEAALNACGECEPEPEEICDDGLDNDGDALIDEGCSRPNGCSTVGATSCADGQLSTCEVDTDGLLSWSTAETCPDGNGFCADAETCGTCTNGCASEGATSCSGGELSTCEADANGCMAYSVTGLTIRGGDPHGVYMNDARVDLTVTDSIIEGNATRGLSIGAYAPSRATANLTDVEIAGNGALTDGSGLYLSSTAATGLRVTIRDNRGSNGAGTLLRNDATLTLTDSAIVSNQAQLYGGAGYLYHESSNTMLTLINVDMGTGATDNYPDDVYVTRSGYDSVPYPYLGPGAVTLDVNNSVLTANSGSGLRTNGSTSSGERNYAALTDVELSHNNADTGEGGGLYASIADVTGTRVIISENTGIYGGGTRIANDATLTLTDSSIVSNQAQSHGGASFLSGWGDTTLTTTNVDMGIGATDNDPEDVYVTSTGSDPVPYPYFGPGEDQVCSATTVRCTPTEPSYTSAGPTGLHCAGAPSVDLNGLATYTTVAEAVYRAPPDSWVSVCPGTYDENVTIVRSVQVVGVDGPSTTILRGVTGAGEPVIHLEGERYNTPAHPRIAVDLDGLTIAGGEDGGVYAHYAVTLGVNNSILTANSGSGLASNGYINSGERNYVTLTDVELSHNVTSGDGGGLYLSTADATGTRVTISDNTALYGGGIALINNAPIAELVDSAILRNTGANYGGGVMLRLFSDAEITMTNCDLGTGADDNAPDDVYIDADSGSDPVYTSYGAGVTVYCQQQVAGCTP